MICKNCSFEGNSKKGFRTLCPKCLMNSLRGDNSNLVEDDVYISTFKGDGSIGIEGNITLKNKDSAIIFVNGIIEQFNIKREDLDL